MIFSLPEYTQRLRVDLRQERVHNETLKRTQMQQKQKIEELKKEVLQWKKKYQEKEKEIEKLRQKIEKLTKTQNRYKVALFDHGNFKSPQIEGKKKKGGQIGHTNTNPDTQRNYASFERKQIHTDTCGHCGNSLPEVRATKEKVLMDIQINTVAIWLIIASERQWCGNCKKEVRAVHPESLPFTEYGMNTFMVVMYLRFKGKQSLQTIATTLDSLFGLSISKAGVGTLLFQAREYLKGEYEELKKEIRKGEIMYNDETGWRVRGKSAWMWIMANEETTVYVAAESRGKGIMEEMYGDSQSYSMHDGYAGYTNTIPLDKHLYCWAHVLRFIHEETLLSKKNSIEEHIKEELVSLYKTIRDHPEYSDEEKEQLLSMGIDHLLVMPEENQTVKNILHRVRTQRDGLIRSLVVTEDGTNNLAERELRPLAISRNISFGSDSYQGMETTAILASIIQTLTRDKTKQFIPTLNESLRCGIQENYPQYKHLPLFAT
ncbi:MAG: IS66 family transposase [Rhabdochlamydiaceae bacterium]